MKRRVRIGLCVLLIIILLVPIPIHLKDGGTIVYNALLYEVENVHTLNPEITSESDNIYLEGIIVRILGIEIYNNVK